MEALALGRPVVTTTIAGIPELVIPGDCGWLVPPGSVEKLAEAMRSALAAPISELNRMGRLGADRAAECHNAATEATKLSGLFRESAPRIDVDSEAFIHAGYESHETRDHRCPLIRT